jgi:3-dehydroquinate synthase
MKIIKKAIEVKRHCVEKDLKDKGVRQLLNVGHTVSHAIELKYGLSHGRAVIIGMLEEFRMSECAGFSEKDLSLSLEALLVELHIKIESKYTPDWKSVSKDKKTSGENLDWPIIVKTGSAKLVKINLSNFRALY